MSTKTVQTHCCDVYFSLLQVYKLIYASQLVDFGLPAQALHYCEAAGLALLAQDQNLHFVLLQQVIKVSLWLWLHEANQNTRGAVLSDPKRRYFLLYAAQNG